MPYKRSRIQAHILLTLLLLGSALQAQESKLKLVFTGDIMGHDSQIASALATGETGYDYKPCFQHLRPYLQEADLVVGNLEVTFAGPPYKGYPAFSSPDELSSALKWAGFDILVNANNHALDRGQKGLVRTIEQLDQRDLVQTGTFANSESRQSHYPLVVEKNGIRVALLNYTYGTNGLKETPPVVVNRIEKVQIQSDLEKAATAEPDFILVCVHWGSEYQLNENSQQRDLANHMFRHGADVIIGSHPHVVQPIRGNGTGDLVVYSMGNLISNQRNRYRDGGILFELELVKGSQGAEVGNFAYLPVWVWKPNTQKGTSFSLVPANMGATSVSQLGMSAEDEGLMTRFLDDTRIRLSDYKESSAPLIATRSPR